MKVLLGIALLMPCLALAQPDNKRLRLLSDSLVQEGIAQKHVPGLGLAIVDGDRSFLAMYGYANIDKKIPIDTSTLFQLGSVGKLFTVIAVLQQVEAGKLDLYADVNQYLSGFATAPPGRPITLFDLLTHTAGLDDRNIGYLARSQKEVKSLGEHLREYMPASFQSPGKEINYSNYSYALAGHIVERATGTSFTEYVRQHVFEPLGMSHTTYDLPDNYQELSSYAHGYRIRDDYEEVTCYPRHATPAGSALSSVGDMNNLLIEFLKPSGKILSDSSMAKLMRPQFTNSPTLMGYTLGMEEQRINGHHGVAKGGAFTGFISEFAVFPKEQIGLFITTNTQTDNFLEVFQREILSNLLPGELHTPQPELKLDLSEFAQTYRSERYNHRTVEDLLSLYQGKLELAISKEGDLTTYQNGAWQHYRPVDSLIFQNTKIPEMNLVFVRDSVGRIARLYTNINIAGFYLPVSLSPVAWYDNPVFINDYYFLILVFLLTFIVIPLVRAWVLLRRRFNPNYMATALVPTWYLYLPLAVMILYIVHLFGGFLYLAQHINDFYFGVPDSWRQVQLITYTFPIVVLLLVITTIRLWISREGRMPFRIYYSLITLSAVIHLVFLYRWHFIGVNV